MQAGRQDLIGEGCDCLIPSRPPKEAIQRRREDANKRFAGNYVHTIPAGEKRKTTKKESRRAPGKSYRPDAKRGKGNS